MTTVPAASTPAVTFTSGGETLAGVLHLPGGAGPHPVVVLLHGFPGNERNFDLAQALRREGYAALVFHYRGSWGMGGDYAFAYVLQDAAAVVAAVRGEVFAGAHRLDPARVAVVGHSLGGFAALMTAAADRGVAAAVSIAGFDVGTAAELCADPVTRAECVEALGSDLLPLRGTSGEALVGEMVAAGPAWRLAGLARAFEDRPVLLVGTGRDPVTPQEVHHQPLVRAYGQRPRIRLEHLVFDTDHALSDHRVELAGVLLDFLGRRLGGAAASEQGGQLAQ